MTTPRDEDTTSPEFFDRMYREDPDPWDFASSEYELGRYRAILAALGERRFRRAFEPGCSVGVLTAGLARKCAVVDAMDISAAAVEQATERCRAFDNVHLTCGSVAGAMPAGTFDLIVMSEIGYYFEETALMSLLGNLIERLEGGGTLLAAHWLGESQDHVLSGDRVHELVGGLAGLEHERGERHAGFRLDCWSKR